MPRRLVSVVVPAYNESDCVDELARRLRLVFDAESDYDWECVIVENGSTDDTWDKLITIRQTDPRFKIVRLSRNFGADGGFTAGLNHIDGDACVLMCADLQDPPEVIPLFLRNWEKGYENIYAIVTRRSGTGPLRRFNSAVFYWLAGKLTDQQLPRNASDFRLVDRKVYEIVRTMRERNRFVRGLFAWVGFRSIGVDVERPERFGGKSKAFSSHVIDLALRGIFANTTLPLRLITIGGLAISVLAGLSLIISSILYFAVGVPFGGFGTIVSISLLLFGTLSFMLGVVSEYVGLIYQEVKQRPNFIVAESIGLEHSDEHG